MKPEDIHITDIMRILLGEVPWSFLIEVIIRMFFVYLLIMLCMRLMGKRMARMLTSLEMAALVSLAAAIGVPILAPDRGLLPAVIIAVVVVGVHRIISYYSYHNQKIENITQGDLSVLVEDGKMLLDVMKLNRITRERLYSQLRKEGILNLGKVKRLYLETSGDFTTFIATEPKPGLSLVPEWDEEFKQEQQRDESAIACNSCGYVVYDRKLLNWKCDMCGKQDWTEAVVS